MYFLGIDGGGTKTQTVITDEKLNILGKSTVGATYLHSVSEDELYAVLEDGLLRALVDSGLRSLDKVSSCFGIAGMDSPFDHQMLSKAVKRITSIKLEADPILTNDAVTALRRGTDKDFGVVVVAGTGSNCYGKNKQGQDVFVGGLGHVLSDEGGSYYIGQRVLHAAAKSYDGRADKTLLENLMYENFGVANMREMIIKVHEKGFGKTQVASLSFICEKASSEGDVTARRILVDAAEELITMVSTCVNKLRLSDFSFDLVCVGGTFKKVDGPARQHFEEKIKKTFPGANIVYPSNEPAMGCVLMAYDKAKLLEKFN